VILFAEEISDYIFGVIIKGYIGNIRLHIGIFLVRA
jgi:hypothetical protein